MSFFSDFNTIFIESSDTTLGGLHTITINAVTPLGTDIASPKLTVILKMLVTACEPPTLTPSATPPDQTYGLGFTPLLI